MLFLQEAMPELRRLHLTFRVQETKSKMGFVFSFEHLASLEHIDVTIRTEDASRRRAVAAEAAVRGAVSIHPAHPTLTLYGGLEQYAQQHDEVCCRVAFFTPNYSMHNAATKFCVASLLSTDWLKLW
jgi:hypothetical protein